MSIYLQHRIHEKVVELESKLPKFWFSFKRSRLDNLKELCTGIVTKELDMQQEDFRNYVKTLSPKECMYDDLADFESCADYKVNESFETGWRMARLKK